MKRIASRDNPFFKTLRRWTDDRAAVDESPVAVLEGLHLCDAFLSSGGVPRHVVVGDGAVALREVAGLVARSSAVETHVLDDRLFASLSGLAHGVPVLMVIDRPARSPSRVVSSTSVLLDRVQDPGNVGSILRSAAAAGIADVYLSKGCAGAWSAKVLRAAMGAHFRLRIQDDCDLAEVVDMSTIPVHATSSHADASLHAVDLTGDVAWLFGHEGQGVDAGLLSRATALRIPQDAGVESLNVAAAAAICFFEQRRQRSSIARRATAGRTPSGGPAPNRSG